MTVPLRPASRFRAPLPGRLATALDAPLDNGTCRFAVVTPGMPEEVTSHSVPESVTMPTRDKTCRKAQGETWLASDTHDGAFRGLSRLPPVTDAT